VTDRGNVGVADAIVAVVKEDAFHRAVGAKVAAMLLARNVVLGLALLARGVKPAD
jgi:hypothetical protein